MQSWQICALPVVTPMEWLGDNQQPGGHIVFMIGYILCSC